MVAGNVNHRGEAILNLVVQNQHGASQAVEAVVDTGFNGWLTLPVAVISDLHLPRRNSGYATLADGIEVPIETYEATLLWDGSPLQIMVVASDSDPLVGMGLLYGYQLSIEVIAGGNVTARKLA